MDKICERNQCIGCGLCSNICPKGAIKMIEDKRTGHFVPQIDTQLCVDCSLCQKKCPGLREIESRSQIKTYAAWRKDISKIKGSSSGGVAASLYERAVEEGYYIVGTYLNENFQVKLKITNKKNDIELFKGSKYVQADTGFVYKEALGLLQKGEKILFIGTPCQCAAMKVLVEGRYENNVILVELICHGTPSQKTFREYINYISKKKKKDITKIAFRSERGVELSLYSGEKAFWQYKGYEDDYMVAFQTGLIHNETCYQCKYANKDRSSDLTIGDFWKIGEKRVFQHPECKVSVVVASTEKGLAFLQGCEQLILEEREYQEALEGNPNLYSASKKNLKSEMFWNIYADEGVSRAYSKTIGKRLKKIRFKNNVKRTIKKAYSIFK